MKYFFFMTTFFTINQSFIFLSKQDKIEICES
jgi:hypothetical protein